MAAIATRSAWVSRTKTGHLDLKCPGLDSIRERGQDPRDVLEQVRIANGLQDLFNPNTGTTRPCRICALTAVLHEVVEQFGRGAPDRVVVSSLASTRGRSWNRPASTPQEIDRMARIRENSAARLQDVATVARLQCTGTSAGQVMFGPVNHRLARELAQYVLVVELPPAKAADLSEQAIQFFWPLLHEGMDLTQAWQTARDLCA